MSDVQLGLLAPDSADRDATHVAVVPVIASVDMWPGQHCGVLSDGRASPRGAEHIGIVDPFLKDEVKAGQKFFLCLYPRTITGLRHVYVHPVLDAMSEAPKTDREASERWIRDFIARSDCPGYGTLMAAAVGDHDKNYGEGGYLNSKIYDDEYLHFGGSDAHGEIPDEFWHHVEVVTGRKPPVRAKYFSCSC